MNILRQRSRASVVIPKTFTSEKSLTEGLFKVRELLEWTNKHEGFFFFKLDHIWNQEKPKELGTSVRY